MVSVDHTRSGPEEMHGFPLCEGATNYFLDVSAVNPSARGPTGDSGPSS